MKHFNCPTQVKFYDAEINRWRGGIAYGDEIICGCCGGILSIDEVLADAEEAGISQGIESYDFWLPFSEEIIGDDFDEEVVNNENF